MWQLFGGARHREAQAPIKWRIAKTYQGALSEHM